AVSFDLDLEPNGQPLRYAISFKFDEAARGAQKVSETIAEINRRTMEVISGFSVPGSPSNAGVSQHWNSAGYEHQPIAKSIHDELCEAQLYRWIPAHLALPVVFAHSPPLKMEPSGFGLAILLDDLWREDRKRYAALEERFRSIFGEIERIAL